MAFFDIGISSSVSDFLVACCFDRSSWASTMSAGGSGALVDQLVKELMQTGADTDAMAFNNAEIQASVDGLLDVVDEMRRMNAELRLENERLLRINEVAASSGGDSTSSEEAVHQLVPSPPSPPPSPQ